MAKCCYEMGKYSEAEIKLTQATQLDPDNHRGILLFGPDQAGQNCP